VRRRLTAFTVSRCEEAPFTFHALNRLGSPTHETAFAVRVQRVLLCTRRALFAARSAARAA